METGEIARAAVTQLGSRYLLGELIGRGAMGRVFAGAERDTGRPVAVKVLRPELVSDPEAVARFMQERQILTSISSPATVRIIDLVAEGETLAIVMELVNGQDLRRFLRERKTLPPAEAVGLAVQLLTGLDAVHAAGVVHRDIKPENLLLDLPEPDASGAGPTLKVTDFGVSRLSYGASLTKLTTQIGTPEYMAPELAEGSGATPAADVYSAGIVLYEMLSGRTPFAGGPLLTVLRRHSDMAPPFVPGLAPALWDQLSALLAKEPAARPAAADAAAALSALNAELSPLPALPPAAEPDSYHRATAVKLAEAAPGGDTMTIVRRSSPGATTADATIPPGAGGVPGPTARPGPRWRRTALIVGVAAVVAALAAFMLPPWLSSRPGPGPATAASTSETTRAAATGAAAAAVSSAAALDGQGSATPSAHASSPRPRTSASGVTGPTVTERVTTTATASAPARTSTPAAPAHSVAPTTAAPAPSRTTQAASAASYASTTLVTSSSAFTARAYFGQVGAIVGALAGQVTFNTLSAAAADNPAYCVETVVFSRVTVSAAVVYEEGIPGWRGAEVVPSTAPQNDNAHQQLIAPPLGVSNGVSYIPAAELAGQLLPGPVTTSAFSLILQGSSGAVQTWSAAGQTVSCDSQ